MLTNNICLLTGLRKRLHATLQEKSLEMDKQSKACIWCSPPSKAKRQTSIPTIVHRLVSIENEVYLRPPQEYRDLDDIHLRIVGASTSLIAGPLPIL
ncbi:unnamed protein product [Schistosoma mattheei]|uniref:Uncharacterized protein n=1 Tax=Schistosoma mattheei TaxID=31246 RepID=A0A183NJP7_9TREM|nr:unnamed protein product [Schistosoma mattheei]